MNEFNKGKTAQDLVHLLVRHDPTVSDDKIAEVVSEWGELMEERSAHKDDPAEGEDTLGDADADADTDKGNEP
jgi:hypothetical protein